MPEAIVLIGFMGSGKTTVGKLLAQSLSVPFTDSDEWIAEQAGKSVATIFDEDGEKRFRQWEQQFVASIDDQPGIIACGGGLPCFNNLLNDLRAHGTVIYLQATPATLTANLRQDDISLRPLLRSIPPHQLESTITERLAQRIPTYRQAHATVTIDGKSPQQIIAEIRLLAKS